MSREDDVPKLFQRIVCPVDFDPNSFGALDTACEIARESGGKVHLLHAVPLTVPAQGQPLTLEPLSGAAHDARVRLERIVGERLAKIDHEIIVVTGDPAAEIIRVADEVKADAIVMATHGRTGLGHLLLGSVAERVVREAPCPVLTIRAPAK